MSAILLREAQPGSSAATMEVIIPMPRSDGKVVGIPSQQRRDSLLDQYEGGKKGIVVLRGRVRADSRLLEAELTLPQRSGNQAGVASGSGGGKEPLLKIRQPAGGADMVIRYRDKITPVQAMHIVLVLNRWWGRRGA